MSVTQYIGARYVPLFAEPAQWDVNREYEPLTIVLYQGNSYTSKQAVPIGIDITNETFWALTGNYNAQVEAYRAEVAGYSERIDAAKEEAESATAGVQALNSDLAEEVAARTAADTAIREDFASDLAEEVASLNTTISDNVDALQLQDNVLGERIDTLDTKVNTTKTNLEAEIATKMDANKISGTIVPYFLGAWQCTGYHPSSMACVRDEYQVVISSPRQGIDTNDYGCVEWINIKNDSSQYRTKKENVVLGHANGLAYCPEKDTFLVAPLYTYTSGKAVRINDIYVYDNTFTTRRVVTMPVDFQSIAYDKVTHKLWGYKASTGAFYEIDYNNNYKATYSFTANFGQYTLVWLQDFAVYNNKWYVFSTHGIMQYGTIGISQPEGMQQISTTCSRYDISVMGEFNGVDFSPEGHMLCIGDMYHGGAMNTGTVFGIPLPHNTSLYKVMGGLQGGATYTIYVDSSLSNTLNQNILSNIADPELISLCSKYLGGQVGLKFNSDFTTDNLYIYDMNAVKLDLNNHTITVANTFRFDGVGLSISNGTVEIKKINLVGRPAHVILTGVTLGASCDTSWFTSAFNGLMVSVGSLTNPNNVGTANMVFQPLTNHIVGKQWVASRES